MADLPLAPAGLKYDQVRALMDGGGDPRASISTRLDIDPEHIHPRMLR